jgi:adenine-specific DNA-methyltransferase
MNTFSTNPHEMASLSRRYPRVYKTIPKSFPEYALYNMDSLRFINKLPNSSLFDLVITSPPYNIGKEYESKMKRKCYLDWQESIIEAIAIRLSDHGSLCWQVGNYIENGIIEPLDILLHPLIAKHGFKLRNRIVWTYGHGLHCQRRFSGRYEVVLWYTKSDSYTFNLDAVRIPSKYPGKRAYQGPNAGKLSSNPNGKNPEDVWWSNQATEDLWNIPNVKGNHKEKTTHPCQFPVALAERLILALSNENDLVFDPFAGVGSSGVAAAAHKRHYWGCDLKTNYLAQAKKRISETLSGKLNYRPHSKPIYDHKKSALSRRPKE